VYKYTEHDLERRRCKDNAATLKKNHCDVLQKITVMQHRLTVDSMRRLTNFKI